MSSTIRYPTSLMIKVTQIKISQFFYKSYITLENVDNVCIGEGSETWHFYVLLAETEYSLIRGQALSVFEMYTNDLGFSGGSDRKESTCKRRGFDPWVGKVKEKGTATHSGILAWRIPWTEEPGSL